MGSFSLFQLVSRWIARALRREGRARRRSPAPRSPSKVAVTSATDHRWPAIGDFAFSVVGESNYQPALKAIAGEHGKKKARVTCTAELFPDDDNPHDDKAVEIRVQGKTVGFLRREEARKFRRRLGQKGLTGQSTFCDAIVIGGGEWRGEARFYGIQLDLKPFEWS